MAAAMVRSGLHPPLSRRCKVDNRRGGKEIVIPNPVPQPSHPLHRSPPTTISSPHPLSLSLLCNHSFCSSIKFEGQEIRNNYRGGRPGPFFPIRWVRFRFEEGECSACFLFGGEWGFRIEEKRRECVIWGKGENRVVSWGSRIMWTMLASMKAGSGGGCDGGGMEAPAGR